MPQIGQFTRETSGFTGRIETFTLFRDIAIVPADPSDAENAPDYRIHARDDGAEETGRRRIGAGDLILLTPGTWLRALGPG